MQSGCKDFVLRPDTRIIDAVRAIDASELQIALVADAEGRLCGTLTDGDVRRGILRGLELDRPVAEIMEREPLCMSADSNRMERLNMMRQARIRHMPLVDQDRRIVRLETLDQLLEPEPRDEWVVIMAGGLGTRLRPLTEDTPKPMLDVGGRPILETTIQRFARQGFRKIFLSVHYLADRIKDHFGDGRRFGAEIAYLHEAQPMGTAGSLSLLPERPQAPVVVTNGDILTAIDAQRIVAAHAKHRPAATMGVCEYATQIPFGVVEAENCRLVRIEEKPVKRHLVNAGIYVLGPEVLGLLRPDQRCDMPELLTRAKESLGEVMVFPIRDYWMDIGRIDDFDRANDDFEGVFAADAARPHPQPINGGDQWADSNDTRPSTRRSTARR